ncbi:hypothetical protein Scel_10350 [Streptomyces cellostaticus]|nr:hypothetical protein Scel_10350 [Streptomyces cellostaticus]
MRDTRRQHGKASQTPPGRFAQVIRQRVDYPANDVRQAAERPGRRTSAPPFTYERGSGAALCGSSPGGIPVVPVRSRKALAAPPPGWAAPYAALSRFTQVIGLLLPGAWM